MQCITIGSPSMTLDQVDTVLSQVEAPDGMTARYVGTTGDGQIRIVSLWESRAHADRFFAETLGPVLARVLGPEPAGRNPVVELDVQRRYERQPVG